MKYCPECGAKLEEKHEKKKKSSEIGKISRYLKYAGVLAIIAASMCMVTGFMGMIIYSQGEYHEEYYQPVSYPLVKQHEEHIITNKVSIRPRIVDDCYKPPVYRYYAGDFIDRYYTFHPQYLVASIVQFFGFFFGLTSGVLILLRKLFPLAILGLATLIGAAVIVAALNILVFIILGIPMLVMSIISMVFTCIQRKEFAS
ncbi:MAG: hypothetical protein DRN01_04650 [Thermoplasmata archaeon]|nr:MAG: hypothetical protein DRN01_04650 [Thermoplasmata archaeon]